MEFPESLTREERIKALRYGVVSAMAVGVVPNRGPVRRHLTEMLFASRPVIHAAVQVSREYRRRHREEK